MKAVISTFSKIPIKLLRNGLASIKQGHSVLLVPIRQGLGFEMLSRVCGEVIEGGVLSVNIFLKNEVRQGAGLCGGVFVKNGG